MNNKITIVLGVLVAVTAEKEWVWDSNSRSAARSTFVNNPDSYKDGKSVSVRYDVTENDEPFDNYDGPVFAGAASRPIPGPAFIPNQRPGGVYGGQNNLNSGYGPGQGNYYPNEGPAPGILTGPAPSWQQPGGPFKEYDRCKCTEKFNCPSPGISYSQCDVGKQYCCYATSRKNQLGGPLPSRPIHSIENGILAGPGGPVDPIPGVPIKRPGFGGYHRPGVGGFGPRPFVGQNTYSPENGILVGPGGPFDRPYRSV